jgi:hypothetical protein
VHETCEGETDFKILQCIWGQHDIVLDEDNEVAQCETRFDGLAATDTLVSETLGTR